MSSITARKKKITISAGVKNILVDSKYYTADTTYPNDRTLDTPVDFNGYTFELEVNTAPDGTGEKLADATVTVSGNNIIGSLTVAQSNLCVSGAVDGVVYASLLGAASGEEPIKFYDLTCLIDDTATVWGAE